MADIQQAAKWMQEGKRVRRACWLPGGFISEGCYGMRAYANDGIELDSYGLREVDSLLADDWELAD